MSQVPAGWHHDPYGRYQQRYWDGTAWTEHVVTNGVQQVDPLGASTAIPIVTPATAYTTPLAAPAAAAELGDSTGATQSGSVAFLDTMGEDSKTRPRPSLRRAVAGIGGAAIAVGVLAALSGDDPSRGMFAGIAVGLLVAAWAARTFVMSEEIAAAAVGIAVVAIPALGISATVSDGRNGFITAFTVAALFIAAWALPGFKGRNLLLGLGALALLGALGSLSSNDQSDVDKCNQYLDDGNFEQFDAECQDVFADSSGILPSGVTDNLGTQGIIYLVGAGVYLGGMWWLDRRGYQGTGTALGAAGLVASLVGTGLLVDDLGSTSGPIFVMLVGLVVCLVGSHGGRRATTWWGATLVAVGVIAFVAVQMEPDSSTATGVAAIIAGVVLVALPLVGVPVQRAMRQSKETAPPPTAQ